MKKIIFFMLLVGSLIFNVKDGFTFTWTKSWSSSDDGSSFGGSDIQNIQNDISTQAITSSNTPAQGAILYYTGSSWSSLAAGTDGQFLETNGAGANPTWSDAVGTIAQVVNVMDGTLSTGTTIVPNDDTIPQNTEGDQYMSLAITPTSATNKLAITVTTVVSNDTNFYMSVALFQDTTANALAAVTARPQNSAVTGVFTFTHYMTSGTTSETTFKVRVGGQGAGTTTFNGISGGRLLGGVMASSITITEIVP